MKLGVVDVGGGMRGVYASGILDHCLEKGISFDCCVGVSAGSANLITYLAAPSGSVAEYLLKLREDVDKIASKLGISL